jgi:hypothetical protein
MTRGRLSCKWLNGVTFAIVFATSGSAAHAQLICPPIATNITNSSIVVPIGCETMTVKVWGGGGTIGRSGYPGNGGGGAAIVAEYDVSGSTFERFWAYEYHTPSNSWPAPGYATEFGWGEVPHQDTLLIAGGGGVGGWVGLATDKNRPDGGAGGGQAGQPGEDGRTWPLGLQLGGGKGGNVTSGGAGGEGPVPGCPGGPFGCLPAACATGGLPNCGGSPGGGGGHGGLGRYGGGGGGSPAVLGDLGSAAGGGGSSFAFPSMILISVEFYDGDRTVPGNESDLDRGHAGEGGIPTEGNETGKPGRVIVIFNGPA